MIRASAPAKINLYLRVLAREESGYHQIETLFCTIGLADTLELYHEGSTIEIDVRGETLGPPEENLVYRAAVAYFEAARIRAGVRIRLEKSIPTGAGLGGGSSDAATTLIALNQLFDEALPKERILQIGAELGSDIPFFLSRSELALAWGRGGRIMPLKPLPTRPMLLAIPGFNIETPTAYESLAGYRARQKLMPGPKIIDPGRLEEWDTLAELAENDFEPPTFERYPDLLSIKTSLQESGASIALMTGSGSAIFGIFPDEESRGEGVNRIEEIYPGCHLIETMTGEIG